MIETPTPDVGGSDDNMEFLADKSSKSSFCGGPVSSAAMRKWKMSLFFHSFIVAFGGMVLIYQFLIAAGI